ncbi:unnamed protein product [Adineta steineri]|uniref:RBD domain-containing protein n=1 Tax=Adineta steineri TaxID=433720 RepID=A0A818HQV2_9BILA|nr:unnamed protein product [Adineta steineri]CAF3508122.1 unnamed protein product [Adineta steineri]
MMMPILDQSPGHHHHHGHGHQTFYHQQHIPEQTGKMQLTLILPNGVPSVISVDANTPMMDLLVQAASVNKLNPSGYSLVVLDSNQHIIHFKANQTVGQIGSSTISLLPKEVSHPNSASKPKAQPFEITVRLQVNLPDAQKILLRVDPTLPLHEIKEQICKQKKYIDPSRYTLCLPNKLDKPLLLGLTLAEYKTNELTLVNLKHDLKFNTNQIQSFDRLYRTRSESQPARDLVQEMHIEHQDLINSKQRPASVQLNSMQGQQLTSLPTRSQHPKTSHTSLHAYWNDPNFDTQSQTSNCSSTTKKRRAPRPPDYMNSTPNDQLQSSDYHQSQESLTESTNGTKQKRKAPVLSNTNIHEENTTDEQQIQTDNDLQKLDITINPVDEQKTPPTTRLVITTHSQEQNITESHSSTPIYSQIHKDKEPIQIESHYSTVKSTSASPQVQQEEKRNLSPTNFSVEEIVQSGIAEPPVVSPAKSSKKSTKSTDGLTKIINDHNERAQIYQANEKQADNVSYFRVAKSRHGKFETDSQGFINTATNVFDSTNNNNTEQQQQTVKTPDLTTNKTILAGTQQQTRGKQAYDLLKKYEKEEEENEQSLQPIDTDYLNIITNNKEKSPTPIQLEVTERTTHISVTVESDRKQLITRASPVSQQTTGTPPVVAPKPSGKTITEYRTVRRIGHDGEATTTTTVRTATVPSELTDYKQLTSLQASTHQSDDLENTDKK